MNRRDLLKLVGALPVLGMSRTAEGAPEAAKVRTDLSKDTFVLADNVEPIAADPARAADRLNANFDRLAASHPAWWSPAEEDLQLQRRICNRLCRLLIDLRCQFLDGHEGEDPAAPFYPHQSPTLIRDHVVFATTDSPFAVLNGQAKPAYARRLRVASIPQFRGMLDDVRAYHGIDVDYEIVSGVASQTALEVCAEIRKDWERGVKTRVYALYMGPFVQGVDPEVAKEFSVERRSMIRYAKFT